MIEDRSGSIHSAAEQRVLSDELDILGCAWSGGIQ
jgi:hypothetical protein